MLERLKENVERSMQAKPILDKEGRPTGEYRYEAAAANRALELIGKEIGMFFDRQELTVQQRLVQMADEPKLEEVKALSAKRSLSLRDRNGARRCPVAGRFFCLLGGTAIVSQI